MITIDDAVKEIGTYEDQEGSGRLYYNKRTREYSKEKDHMYLVKVKPVYAGAIDDVYRSVISNDRT